MAYILFVSRSATSWEDDGAHLLSRHAELPQALEAYGKALAGEWETVILAEELKPAATIEVRLGNSGASVKLTSD